MNMADPVSSSEDVEDLKEIVNDAETDEAADTALDRLIETADSSYGTASDAQSALREIAKESDDPDIATKATEAL